MINPLKYVDDFINYIKEPAHFEYGMLCILNPDSPAIAKESYEKYIKLCSKVIQSWDETIIDNWEIKGFDESDNKIQQQQIDIAKKLIDSGIINKKIKHGTNI